MPSSQAISTLIGENSPTIDRNIVLRCVGDWGHANFHKLMSFITQEFTERCGPKSKTCIWSVAGGGMDVTDMIDSGLAHIAINTPVKLIANAVTGTGLWASRGPAPHLRALATIPQNDRMMLGLDPSLGCNTFADLRAKKPKLKIILGPDNDDSPIGYVAHRYLEAHGVSIATIIEWGGEAVFANRPEECLIPCKDVKNGYNAVIQEAVMTDWWTDLIDGPRAFIPIPAEPEALTIMEKTIPGLPPSKLPAGYWKSLKRDIPALEFIDFILMCRDDLPDDMAYLITWILVTQKEKIERQYYQFPGNRSPISWPMDPKKMAQTTIKLHPGAEKFYREHGYL